MDGESPVGRVVGALYDAAAEPALWPAALGGLVDLLGGVGASLVIWDRRRDGLAFLGLSDHPLTREARAPYERHYGPLDPIRRLAYRQPVGAVFSCHDHVTADEVRRSAYYNEFLIPHGGRFIAGCLLLDGADLAASIGVHSDAGHGPLPRRALAVYARLAPHLGRAARLHHALGEARLAAASLAAALDGLAFGAVVADALGRVLALNRAALEIAARGDGLSLSGGRLGAARPGEAEALAHLVAGAARAAARRGGGAGGGALRVSRADGRRAYAVLVAPLSADTAFGAGAGGPAALVLIAEPGAQPAPAGRTLVELFGLTQGEARLAVELAAGLRLEEVAGARGVAPSTVRSQLKAILAKTGTRRQAELLRLLAGLPALRGPR